METHLSQYSLGHRVISKLGQALALAASAFFKTSPLPALALVNRTCVALIAGTMSLLCLSAMAQSPPPGPPLPLPAQYEAGSVVVSQPDEYEMQWVPFNRTFKAPPVVIVGPATKADGSPLTVSAIAVYTTGFYCQLNEWEYLDGAHANETVHFLALSEGTHVFGSQRWQVGHLTALNRSPASVALTGFTATPVVLAQVNSYNNWTDFSDLSAIKTRVNNVTNTGFQVNLESQQADAAVALLDESVSYIAVSQGTGYLDGKILSAVRTPTASTTNVFSPLTFPAARTNPLFIAQTQTANDTNPGELRMQALTTTGVQVQFQEEISAEADETHAAEALGYIVMGDMNGESLAKIEVGDLNVTQANATTWTTVTLGNTYTAPVVVMGPLSYTNGTPLTVRVRNVTATSFEFQVDRWDHTSAAISHNYLEHLSYMVMESGTYAVGGVVWQAGRKAGVTKTASAQSFAASFSSIPVVFSQVATTVDPAAVQSRVSGVSGTGFSVELNESEIDATAHAGETVHWIAMTAGTSNLFSTGMRLQAGSVTNVDSAFRTVTFSRMHADPYLLASLQTKNDIDAATLRWRNLFADRVELVAQEDNHPLQFGEGSVNNYHSPETTAFLVVQGAPDTDGDGAPDAWETSVGLNPNNASDGAADSDSDLLTNQQEYHNRLDFTTSSNPFGFTGGIVTIYTGANAFEINDKSISPATSTPGRWWVSRIGGFAPLTINFTTAGTATTDTTRAPASAADFTLWTAATGGTELTTSISLPANSTGTNVYVRPVADSIDEYVEGLRATLAANGSNYTIGSSTNAVVLISDAQDIPANNKLFVGSLLPQSGAATSASGFATIILNGPNTKARISTTFNGLTTPQLDIDGSHVHYANTGTGPIADKTIIYGEPDGLPPGQLSDYPWTIVDSAGLKAQQIIDALFRKNTGENIYVNVHTTRYAGGEIRANLTLQTGSAIFTPPPASGALENLANDEEVKRDCARFLTQATFGATETGITALFNTIAAPKTTATNRIAAFTTWLNNQWAVGQTKLYDYNYAADAQEWSLWGQQPDLPAVVDNPATTTVDETYPAAPPPNNPLDWTRWNAVPSPAGAWTYRPIPVGKDREGYDPDNNNRRRGWWLMATRGKDQLRQRAAFALEQIFVVSDREGTVNSRHYGHSRYYDMLGDSADGVRHIQPPNSTYSSANGAAFRVRELLEDISKSPIMGKYLSHLKNQKAQYDTGGNQILSPDENYAREIMQLFSIGLLELHPDGTLKLGGNGQPVGTYDNDDIKELSKVFTGWSFAWVQNSAANSYVPALAQTNFFGSEGAEYFHPGYENPMKNFAAYHDEGAKSFLSASLPAYAGLAADATARAAYAETELDGAMDALFNHPNIAPFLSQLLIQRFVTSNPSPGYVYRVAQKFVNDGAGIRGNLRAVINAILLDYEARTLKNVDPQTVNLITSVNVSHGKVKEPIIGYTQVLRAFGAKSQINVSALSSFGYPAAQLSNLDAGATQYRFSNTVADLGQAPNNMPSVFNWYLPDYTPGGRLASAGLVAPELQIMTENLAVRAINYHRAIDYNSIVDPAAALPTGLGVQNLLGDTTGLTDNIRIDVTTLVTDYVTRRGTAGETDVTAATWLVDRLDALLCSGSLKAKYPYTAAGTNPRSILIDQIATISPTTAVPVPKANAGNRVRAALYLLTASPEFIVQK
ncbi:hypothetical protein BH11VER1_BH11VER1_27950 [soil metagenome]